MTEQEWLACGDPEPMLEFLRGKEPDYGVVVFAVLDPEPMLEFLRGKGSDRKLRLFAAACCRGVWHLIGSAQGRNAVEVAERVADGGVSNKERRNVQREANHGLASFALFADVSRAVEMVRIHVAISVARPHEFTFSEGATHHEWAADFSIQNPAQSAFLRDIFGNPFRPVVFNPAWRTDTAVSLARQMYEAREFGAMPILADALQDAGCEYTDVLNHCRDSSATHVRGCWVVDLVLGKV